MDGARTRPAVQAHTGTARVASLAHVHLQDGQRHSPAASRRPFVPGQARSVREGSYELCRTDVSSYVFVSGPSSARRGIGRGKQPSEVQHRDTRDYAKAPATKAPGEMEQCRQSALMKSDRDSTLRHSVSP